MHNEYRGSELHVLSAFRSPPRIVYSRRNHGILIGPDLDKGNDLFGDRGNGCFAVVLADRHIVNKLPLDGFGKFSKFLDGIKLSQN